MYTTSKGGTQRRTPRGSTEPPSSPNQRLRRHKRSPGRLGTSDSDNTFYSARDTLNDAPGRSRKVSKRTPTQRSNSAQQLQQQTYSFYNSGDEGTGSSDGSSENYEEELEQEGEEGMADAADVVREHVLAETEAQKRKERRYAKKAREREGDRRRKEGKPRN